jgi:hypothetical protein
LDLGQRLAGLPVGLGLLGLKVGDGLEVRADGEGHAGGVQQQSHACPPSGVLVAQGRHASRVGIERTRARVEEKVWRLGLLALGSPG